MYDQTKHRIKVIQAKDPLSFERQYAGTVRLRDTEVE